MMKADLISLGAPEQGELGYEALASKPEGVTYIRGYRLKDKLDKSTLLVSQPLSQLR